MVDGLLRKLGRLVVSKTEEMGVDDWREERVLEEKSSEHDADENEHFGISYDTHGGVVVC